ncbi:hypothetical protein BDV95DRAFT_164000 [Massariosphaeria phaeospora]|uniref:Uncharacterized protein n=1 Tax=Massariosphaeria phaeospora TaxID=100035 RepID=A0A7C8MA18_9PLEO|nr:hypothetical protein BDV95DRAFT_164000 [Massariosphaeria phaeospora]
MRRREQVASQPRSHLRPEKRLSRRSHPRKRRRLSPLREESSPPLPSPPRLMLRLPLPPAPAPAPLPEIMISSSPPLPPQPLYTISIQYRLRVNGAAVGADSQMSERAIFALEDAENQFLEMVDSPASRIEGREYRWVSKSVSYRAAFKGRSMFKTIALPDFGDLAGGRLLQQMDAEALRHKADQMDLKFEALVDCEAIKSAFGRHGRFVAAKDAPSSDPAAAATPEPARTKQLLKEAKQMERADKIYESVDHVKAICAHWVCRESVCNNSGAWCYVPNPQEHFAITPADMETWAHKIVAGDNGVAVMAPPIQLLEHWRRTGNKLTVNPHNRRRKKGRRGSSSSDDGESIRKLQKRAERQRVEMEMRRMREREGTHCRGGSGAEMDDWGPAADVKAWRRALQPRC